MRVFWATWGCLAAFALLSCGGSNGAPAHVDSGSNGAPAHVEISGMAPAEGAQIAARAVCMHQAQCGKLSIMCMGGGPVGGNASDAGVTMSCTATIRTVDFDDCFEDASSDLEGILAHPSATPDQVDMLERCFDEMNAERCVTQTEADERARASETGSAAPDEAPSPACALLGTTPTRGM